MGKLISLRIQAQFNQKFNKIQQKEYTRLICHLIFYIVCYDELQLWRTTLYCKERIYVLAHLELFSFSFSDPESHIQDEPETHVLEVHNCCTSLCIAKVDALTKITARRDFTSLSKYNQEQAVLHDLIRFKKRCGNRSRYVKKKFESFLFPF